MTHRSGAGPIEPAILQAADAAARPHQYIGCAHLLPVIEEHTGLGPRYAHEALLDLARPSSPSTATWATGTSRPAHPAMPNAVPHTPGK